MAAHDGQQGWLRVAVGGFFADRLLTIEREFTITGTLPDLDLGLPNVPDSELIDNYLGKPDYRRAVSAELAARTARTALRQIGVILSE